MRKIVAIAISALFLLSASTQGMAASVSVAAASAGNTAVPVSSLPDDPATVRTAAASTQPVSFELAESTPMEAPALGQTAPAPAPQKHSHHGHHVRTIVILVAVGVVMPIVLAILAK